MNQFQFAEAYVELTAKDGKFRSALAAAEVKIRKLQSSMEGMSRVAKGVFIAGAAAIGYFVKQATIAQQVIGKFNAVFKGGADAAGKWAEDQAKVLGRSAYDLKSYLANAQGQLVSMGFSRGVAADMSKQLTTLALDLAAFNDVSDSDALRALMSVMAGSTMAARQFGVVIDDAAMKQALLRQGFKGSTSEATPMQKALARLAIITERTSDANGEAARSAGEAAGEFRTFHAQLKDIGIEIGNIFLPMIRNATKGIGGLLESVRRASPAAKESLAAYSQLAMAFTGIMSVLPGLVGMTSTLVKVIGSVGAGAALSTGLIGGLVLALSALAASFAEATRQGSSFGEGVASWLSGMTGMDNAVTKLREDMDDMKKRSQELRDLENETANLRRQREAGWGKSYSDIPVQETPSQEAAKRANAAQNTASRVAKELQNARERLNAITPRRAPPGTKDWQGRPVMFYGDQDQYRREGPALKKRIGVLQNQLANAQDEVRMLSYLARERGMAERRNAAAEGWAGTVGKAKAAHEGVMSALFGDDWQKKMDAAKRELDRPLWEKMLRGLTGAGQEKGESGGGLMDKAASAFASAFKQKANEQEEKWFPPAKSKAEMPGLGTDFVGIGDLPRFMQQQITRGEQELIRIQKEQLAEAKATTEAIEDAAFDIKKELGQHFPGWGK